MCYLPMDDLAKKTFNSKEDAENLAKSGIEVFYAAMVLLQSAGMDQVHVQLLLGKPFSAFTQDHCFAVKTMALALERNRATVAQWHDMIRNAALWAQMHNQSFGFTMDTLPDINYINSALGLSHMGKQPSPNAAPPVGFLAAPNGVEEDIWIN